MNYVYQLLWWIFLLPIIVFRYLKDKKLPFSRFLERFAIYQSPLLSGGIVLHAVSLGEVRAASSLIDALIEKYPKKTITITCTTLTGSEQIQKSFAQKVQHVFLPLDHPLLISRFLNQLQPELLLIMETELWPSLLQQTKKQTIPTAIINARLSERSYNKYAYIKRWLNHLLENVQIYTQSEADSLRFQKLSLQNVQCMGNLKYELDLALKTPNDQQQTLKEALIHRSKNCLIWCVASTHAGEDEQILEALKHAQQNNPQTSILLILAPRHPERFDAVERLIQKENLRYVKRSTLFESPIDPKAPAEVILFDSIGELLTVFSLADIVTIGGSLVAKGGHNILEAAFFAKAIIVGKHMFHFQEVYDDFYQASALLVVNQHQSLIQCLDRLIQAPELRAQLGAKAYQCYLKKQGALTYILNKIEQQLSS